MAIRRREFEVTVTALPEHVMSGTLWFGSARVSGIANGERFSAEFDFSHQGFASKQEAEAYARERVQERLASGLFGAAGDASTPSEANRLAR